MSEVRDRLTERISAARLKLEAKRSGTSFGILLVAVAVALATAVWIFSEIAPTLVSSSHEVAFEVESGRAVRPGLNEVRVKGIPAGRVKDVRLDKGQAVVVVEIRKPFGAIYNDARAELRPNSALEDQFIDIVDRGTRSAGKADAEKPLPAAQTDTPVSVDDVLSVFNGRTRDRLRVLLADLGGGLEDHGAQLNNAFAAAVPLLEVAGRFSRQIAVRERATRRLVQNAAILTQELARRDRQLRTLVGAGARTLSALHEENENLDLTLAEIPPTLDALDTSFAATRGVLGDVNTAVRALRPVADELDPALKAVKRIAEDADPAVAALQRPVRELRPLAVTLPPLSRNLSTSIARLRPQIDTVDKITNNLANCEKGVQGFFQWDASMTKFGDVRGQAPRGNVAVGLQTLGLPSPSEFAIKGCTDGAPIGGRPPEKQDEG